VKSGAAGDTTYTRLEDEITRLTNARDALANRMRQALDDAAFGNAPINVRNAQAMVAEANRLIAEIAALR
jgi:hypothetical protein